GRIRCAAAARRPCGISAGGASAVAAAVAVAMAVAVVLAAAGVAVVVAALMALAVVVAVGVAAVGEGAGEQGVHRRVRAALDAGVELYPCGGERVAGPAADAAADER